ncbi:hypothetical protein IV203_036087 [Nitzschia inconspicua]|uniref:Transmembrane protein n=1 Tax=Nitzschia inconspicua TaxID=303405 RepID=A0A9K3PV76_9STRA|nr:hypothetical protein IV203_036087 [Nitzschia inconspicua]
MKKSPTSNPTTSVRSLKEPLLVAAVPMDSSRDDSPIACGDSSKSTKRNEQLQVHRLLSFLIGSLAGVFLQVASVVVFFKLIIDASERHRDEVSNMLRGTADGAVDVSTMEHNEINPYDAIMKSEDSTWFNVAIWMTYHASLCVYLVVWTAMITLAISKIGWRYISTGLYIPPHVTRRTCFLRTFFFINGFVQGSLMPWIVLELHVGTWTSLELVWMPMVHLCVFLVVVFTYDWMEDEVSTDKIGSGKDVGDEDDNEDEVYALL